MRTTQVNKVLRNAKIMTITLQTKSGPVDVEATVRGAFAAHVRYGEESNPKVRQGFTVTHVQSGMRVSPRFLYKRDALSFASDMDLRYKGSSANAEELLLAVSSKGEPGPKNFARKYKTG